MTTNSNTRKTLLKNHLEMQSGDLKQMQFESDAWKRSLGFMIDETIFLKTRLGEILKEKNREDLLFKAEEFQARLLRHDDLVTLIKHDISHFDKLLIKEVYLDGAIVAQVFRQFKNMRVQMRLVEKRFSDLKHDFNIYYIKNE